MGEFYYGGWDVCVVGGDGMECIVRWKYRIVGWIGGENREC